MKIGKKQMHVGRIIVLKVRVRKERIIGEVEKVLEGRERKIKVGRI